MTSTNDIRVLRDLAARYVGICDTDTQRERRDLWRKHNSLVKTRPPIYVRGVPWNEVPELQHLECDDPFLRRYETWFRQMLYQETIGDDYVFEPWVTVDAAHVTPPQGIWGVEVRTIPSPEPAGAWRYDPPLKRLEDRARLTAPHHVVNEQDTTRKVARLQDAIGDIITVAVDRAPAYRVWNADISTQLAYLRGLEQVMWDMVDHPQWLHELLAFMRDGIVATHQEAEAAGDWRLCAHENQAMPYAEELPDPSADPAPVARDRLWVFVAAQELTWVSPEMHDEFMLQYQRPIIERFGLVAYGCCEDLTEKISILRQIPNLRRIAVAPRANVRRCAERIQGDYVLSWRPNPAEMVCCGFDRDHIRAVVRDAMEACTGCHADITLKDIHTVEGRPERLREWVRIVRSVSDDY
ncbi:MAG: hypothetical protein JSV65_18685 [Armatimonadota bacterium]|nr:MAG: hypothetical protein JSV65_18685 [Armatimonadota bacterium]